MNHARCPRCGHDQYVGVSGCPRWGFRRYGGKLTPRTEPVPCHRTTPHTHYFCIDWGTISGPPKVTGCGHKWTR